MAKVSLDPFDRKTQAFCRWFKGKRAEENITQAELGNKLYYSQAQISNKLSGKSVITYKDLLVFFKESKATDEEIVRMMRI